MSPCFRKHDFTFPYDYINYNRFPNSMALTCWPPLPDDTDPSLPQNIISNTQITLIHSTRLNNISFQSSHASKCHSICQNDRQYPISLLVSSLATHTRLYCAQSILAGQQYWWNTRGVRVELKVCFVFQNSLITILCGDAR